MSKNKIKLSIIIPAFEEEGMLASSLHTLENYLTKSMQMKSTEVIVVNADSEDSTRVIAKAHAELFDNYLVVKPGPRVGKGRDVRTGFKAATGEIQLFTDADFATPVQYIDKLIKEIKKGADVVIGERDLNKIHKNSFSRRHSSKISNWLIRLVVLPGFRDTQCGFKGFTKSAAKKVFSKQQILGWGFDIEILKIARSSQLNITSMMIPDWHDPKGDLGLVGDSQTGAMLKTLLELFRIRLNVWRGKYK